MLELSTNVAGNLMPPIAVGWKDWVHLGSPKANPNVASILSVLASCQRFGIPFRDYLSCVLPRLAGVSVRKMPELTRAARTARQAYARPFGFVKMESVRLVRRLLSE